MRIINEGGRSLEEITDPDRYFFTYEHGISEEMQNFKDEEGRPRYIRWSSDDAESKEIVIAEMSKGGVDARGFMEGIVFPQCDGGWATAKRPIYEDCEYPLAPDIRTDQGPDANYAGQPVRTKVPDRHFHCDIEDLPAGHGPSKADWEAGNVEFEEKEGGVLLFRWEHSHEEMPDEEFEAHVETYRYYPAGNDTGYRHTGTDDDGNFIAHVHWLWYIDPASEAGASHINNHKDYDPSNPNEYHHGENVIGVHNHGFEGAKYLMAQAEKELQKPYEHNHTETVTPKSTGIPKDKMAPIKRRAHETKDHTMPKRVCDRYQNEDGTVGVPRGSFGTKDLVTGQWTLGVDGPHWHQSKKKVKKRGKDVVNPAARIDAHPHWLDKFNDPEVDTVIFGLEGRYKNDSHEQAAMDEGIINAAFCYIPSVTLGSNNVDVLPGAKKLIGKTVPLICDADWPTNPMVVMHARLFALKLRLMGVDKTVVAAPPLVNDKPIKVRVKGEKKVRKLKGSDDFLVIGLLIREGFEVEVLSDYSGGFGLGDLVQLTRQVLATEEDYRDWFDCWYADGGWNSPREDGTMQNSAGRERMAKLAMVFSEIAGRKPLAPKHCSHCDGPETVCETRPRPGVDVLSAAVLAAEYSPGWSPCPCQLRRRNGHMVDGYVNGIVVPAISSLVDVLGWDPKAINETVRDLARCEWLEEYDEELIVHTDFYGQTSWKGEKTFRIADPRFHPVDDVSPTPLGYKDEGGLFDRGL